MDVKLDQTKTAPDPVPGSRFTRLAWLVAAAAFALYAYLAWRNPAVYWYDSTDRLALRDRLLVGHWLPLVQAVIFLISRATRDLLVVRLVLAAIAALSIVAMDCLATRLFRAQTGPVSAVLLASNVLFVALAIVPYPDVLFVGLMLTALYHLSLAPSRNHVLLGMLALNPACLTRYEGWILAGLIAMAAALRFARQLAWSEMRRFAATEALTALAPVAWLILGVNTSGGLLSSLATVVGFEQDRLNTAPFLPMIDPGYVRQFATNFLHLLTWQLGVPLIAAGLLGWLLAVRRGRNRSVHILIAVFCLLDLALLALWRPWPFDNLRQTFIVLVFLILYAEMRASRLAERPSTCLRDLAGPPSG